MKLLTKAVIKKLPKLYATEDTPTEAKVAVLKFFGGGRGTWFVVEGEPVTPESEDQLDSVDWTFFGFVRSPLGDCDEWGYFTLGQLREARFQFGLGIERDMHFTPATAGYDNKFTGEQHDSSDGCTIYGPRGPSCGCQSCADKFGIDPDGAERQMGFDPITGEGECS